MSDQWIPNPRPFPTRPPAEWPAPSPPPPDRPGDPDPAPAPARPPSRVGMILAVIGLALLAALVTYLVLRLIRPPEPRVAPATTTVSTTTSTTLPSGPTITAAELARLVDELVPFVQDARRLTFRSAPEVVLSDEAAYTAALDAHLAAGEDWLERLTVPFEVLGLNANDADMTGALRAFTGEKTAVFYDPENATVHVRPVPATPYLSTMVVVGLVQALDDQHFRTGAVAAPEAYGDGTFGLATLVGGDAWRIASQWADGRSADDQLQIRDELQTRRGADADTARVPAALAEWLRYPADEGVRFTANMVTSRSSGPLDAAFRNPPDGSAQVQSPARFTAHIDQLSVATPRVDGQVHSSGTLGRLFLEAAVGPVAPSDQLARAMSGYRGDTLVAYESDDAGSCVRMDVTTGDAEPDHMHQVLDLFAAQRGGEVALVPDPDRDGRRLVRLDLCVGGGSAPDSTTTTTTPGSAGTDSPSTVPGGPLP